MWTRNVLGMALGSMLLACSASAQQKTVVLGVSGRPDQAALQLALDRGYFAQQGLDIKTVQAGSGLEMIPSLASNQIQVASGSPSSALFNALNRGIDIRIVADFAHNGGPEDRTRALVVRADLIDSGAVKGPADLKGRSMAFQPGLGQMSDALFDKIFAPLGIGRNDVNIQYLSFPNMLPALTSKAIDSAIPVEPAVTLGEQQNIARVLVTGGAAYPGGELSVVYYSSTFAADADAAVKFMVAYLRGLRDFHDAIGGKDRAAVAASLAKSLGLRDPSLLEQAQWNVDLNGVVNVADLKYQASVYRQIGAVSGAVPDVDRYVDSRFAEAAVKILGAR